jgi:2,3-bisphosphoglycerate-dependent phosphoglycerate mutase
MTSGVASARSSSAGMPTSGSAASKSKAPRTASGASPGVTGRAGIDSRKSARSSTSRCPSRRNSSGGRSKGVVRPSTASSLFVSAITSAPMELLIVARHGETEASARAHVSGDPTVEVRLTPTGLDQARRLGEALARDPIDLCVVTEFGRTAATADVALAGRDVPRVVVADLNDPRPGRFEGGRLADYRAWARANASTASPPGGGESRATLVCRCARGFRTLLGRPERVVLHVGHSLPLAYLLGAVQGEGPARVMPLIDYAEPRRLATAEVRRAVERLDSWCEEPDW